LAEWERSLPVESLAPVGILFFGGAALLAFGQRLLKPVLVVAAVFAGVVLGVRVGHALQVNVSPIIWSVAGAFGGILAVVLSYRVALATSVAAIGAVAAMLVATAAAEMGLVEVGAVRRGDESSLVSPVHDPLNDEYRQGSSATGGSKVDDSDAKARRTAAEEAKSAVATELDRVSPGLGPSFLAWSERFQGFVTSIGDWTQERWSMLPRPMRTLLLAAGAAGAFLGFVAGLASPVWAAATVTSLFGALLVLACGVPLASRFVPPDAMPELAPLGWLAAWLGLAATGWAFQWRTRPQSKSKRAAKSAEPEAA